jgi:hypothetical protein
MEDFFFSLKEEFPGLAKRSKEKLLMPHQKL